MKTKPSSEHELRCKHFSPPPEKEFQKLTTLLAVNLKNLKDVCLCDLGIPLSECVLNDVECEHYEGETDE